MTKPRTSHTIMVGVATMLIGGTVIAGFSMWKSQVTEERVVELSTATNPYPKDKPLIDKALKEELPELRKDVRELHDVVIEMRAEQRIILQEVRTRR